MQPTEPRLPCGLKKMRMITGILPIPTLLLFVVTDEMLKEIKTAIPALPEERVAQYMHDLQLPEYDARVLPKKKNLPIILKQIIEHTTNYKAAANWMLGPVNHG